MFSRFRSVYAMNNREELDGFSGPVQLAQEFKRIGCRLGASMCALQARRSVATTRGLAPSTVCPWATAAAPSIPESCFISSLKKELMLPLWDKRRYAQIVGEQGSPLRMEFAKDSHLPVVKNARRQRIEFFAAVLAELPQEVQRAARHHRAQLWQGLVR